MPCLYLSFTICTSQAIEVRHLNAKKLNRVILLGYVNSNTAPGEWAYVPILCVPFAFVPVLVFSLM